MRIVTVQYRSKDGSTITEKQFDFFDDSPPAKLTNDLGTVLHKLPNAACKGWSLQEHTSKDGKHTIEEFWENAKCPKSFVRDGIEYFRQYGVPQMVEQTRLGTGLLQQTDKSFQDIIKNMHKRTGRGSQLGDKL